VPTEEIDDGEAFIIAVPLLCGLVAIVTATYVLCKWLLQLV
jgi:hypothetical protein